MVRFGDVVKQVKVRVDPDTAGLDRYVAGEHMSTDDLRIRRWGEVGDGYLGPAFNMKVQPGQVLYGSRRTYLRKVAVPDFEGICANTTFVVESSSPDLLQEFLPYAMTTETFHEHSIKQSKGSVNPYINFTDLKWYEFALPPIDEQERIVQLLSEIRRSVEMWEVVAFTLQTQRAAFANEVVEAGLATGALTKVVDLVASDRPVTYGILKPGTGHPDGIPVIKVKDYPNGHVVNEGLLLTSPEIESGFKRSRLRAGDLLISIRGTVGRIAEVPEQLEGANITQDTARLSIGEQHDKVFIRHMLESPFVQRQIQSRVTGLAVKGLNIGELRKIEITTPHLEVQRQLANRFDVIEDTQNRVAAHLQYGRVLARATLERCLEGREL